MRPAEHGEKIKLMRELVKDHPTLTARQLANLFAKTASDRAIRFNVNPTANEFASFRWKEKQPKQHKPQPTPTATNKPTSEELTAALNELRELNKIRQRLGTDGFKAACDLLNAA